MALIKNAPTYPQITLTFINNKSIIKVITKKSLLINSYKGVVDLFFLTFFLPVVILVYPLLNNHYMKQAQYTSLSRGILYTKIMLFQWGMVLFFFAFWFFTGRTFHDLLFLDKPIFSFSEATSFALIIGAGLCMAATGLIIRTSKKLREKAVAVIPSENLYFLLPTTRNERLFFLLIALLVSVSDEIIFRGVMLHYLSNLPMELSLLMRGMISSLCFGIIHLYQGWRGFWVTASLGMLMFLLFVGTGNLLVPILFHLLIDAKFVFLPSLNPAVQRRTDN